MFLARVNDHVSTVTLYVASDCAVFCYHRQPTLGLGIVFQVDHTKAALGEKGPMRVFLINPSDIAFGIGVITPRWLFVLAGATPARYGVPIIVDETLAALDPANIDPGDVVGIGIHTANALRGMEVGRLARKTRSLGNIRRGPCEPPPAGSARTRLRSRRR